MLNLQNEEQNNKDNNILDFEIINKEVNDRIKALKNNKQPGLDMIPNEFHQICKSSYTRSSCRVFQ